MKYSELQVNRPYLLNSGLRKWAIFLLKKIVYFCRMETTITTPVTLTEGAIKEIRKLMTAEGFDTTQVIACWCKRRRLFRHDLYFGI